MTGPWGSRAAAITAFFELVADGDGHCMVVSAKDGSLFLQVMVFPDRATHMEISERLAMVIGEEQLEAQGWSIPRDHDARVGDGQFAHPVRTFAPEHLAEAARVFCSEVDRICAEGGWRIEVFERVGDPG